MTIEVNTRLYQFNHGHNPRGRGYWAFEIDGEIYWSSPDQLYSEAASDARKMARIKGATEIKVMP
jgi:hypothetical protein